MAARTVREIMTTDPSFALPATPVFEVAKILDREDIGSLPIVDNHKLVGIVTDRDIALTIVGEQRPYDTPIRDVMTSRPQTAAPDTAIHSAAQIMQTHQIRRLPIVDADGALVGIVSLSDLATDTESEALKAETLEEVSTPTR
jgi:CBS domain-containing protein